MLVSVITVCYNAERTIADTLKSVVSQIHTNYEHLVIDGASKDRTLEIIEAHRNGHLRVISERDGGIYDAMNKGLRLYQGDAVGFLNADDAFHDETALQALADALIDCDIVYGDLHCVTDQKSKHVVRVWEAGDFPKEGFHLGWVTPHPTFYVRRHVIEKVRGYNLKYQVASDYDFMLRATSLPGIRIGYVPRVLVDYQLGGISSGTIRSIIKGNLECLDSRRRNLGHSVVDLALISRPLRRIRQFSRAFIGSHQR